MQVSLISYEKGEFMDTYFLSVILNGEKIEREVTLKEYCEAERLAGFRPKMASDNPAYMITPATAGFGSSVGISGRIKYGHDCISQNNKGDK